MLICQYCNKECKNSNSHKNHERSCPKNENRVYKNGMLGKSGKNQWIKAKESGKEYVLSQEAKHNMSNAQKGRKHSEETKNKISKSRKQFLEENPDKVPYKLNHYSKGPSYPETYWKAILDLHNIRYEEQYQVSLYSLDFAIVDKNIDLEIDGDQHYLDERIAESDKRRTQFLEEQGWTVLRIRWSDYQRLDRLEKESFVKNVIEQLE